MTPDAMKMLAVAALGLFAALATAVLTGKAVKRSEPPWVVFPALLLVLCLFWAPFAAGLGWIGR